MDELLSGVTDYVSRACVVDPLSLSWRSGTDLLARNARSVAESILDRVPARPILLGQCSGANFTISLAAALSDAGRPPGALLIVDPLQVTPELLGEEAAALVGRLGGDEELARAVVAGLPGDASPSRLSAFLDEKFHTVAMQRVAGLDLDEETAKTVAHDIVGRYVDWLCFLAAQITTAARPVTAPTYLVGPLAAESLAWLPDIVAGADAPDPLEDVSTAVARILEPTGATGDRR
ncbi:hypothetical protein [Actinoplanes sp. NBRC 101535]|uniref:hypothetical protein n=1 Tax=Actinoplanes sp. NBRC 101535 TaxID=3032196 RepID=UPI0024A0D31E|nr:hypothetical protein [Actinoplanes sp. NBRC 101535]GLY02717.1 hypothetical protein Acsp01_30960 [Actinoplanes sp. NBRC 101535]